MSDPIKLNTSSPGAFVQPTQAAENSLVPATGNPALAASMASQRAAQGLSSPAVQAGGSTQVLPTGMGTVLSDCCADPDGSGTGTPGPPGPPGTSFGVVIYWLMSQTWSQIVAQLPDPSTGQGALVILADGSGTYLLTAGSFNLDNVIFEGSGLTPDAPVLRAAAGFNLNASSVGNFFVRNLSFTSAGTILDTANGGGSVNIVAVGSSLNLVVDTFVLDTSTSGDLTLIDSEILGLAGGRPLRARSNATWNVSCQNAFIGAHIFHANDGTPTLNINSDVPTIITSTYQDTFVVSGSTIDGENEIALVQSGVVTIDSQISDGSDGTSTIVRLRPSGSNNITGITITHGYPGQQMVLVLQQNPGDASPTWPTTITNVFIAGGTFAKTTTVGAIDTMWLEYSGLVGAWLCLSYAKNLTGSVT